ncbi:UbiA prenyltransferase family protein [Longispora albida]|uniref:UbiA prenyltransferase family protein n=1 Tax=Longispora albida TaxID=203523 RepID=UPI000369CC63|nr:UbiA prenyltransferase family protein [Longispora albida]
MAAVDSQDTLPELTRSRTELRGYLSLLRPGQWAKNILVVPLPLLDAPAWTAGILLRTLWAIAAFTLASATVYVINDIADRRTDRLHPVKRHRPIAAGRIGVRPAALLATALAGAIVAMVLAWPVIGWWPLLAYLALNAGYSAWLKRVPLLDLFVVACGFVLRVTQGYLATGDTVSDSLGLCVLGACLLLVLGKRRQELAALGARLRPALRGYTTGFIDQLLVLCAGLILVSYLVYLRVEIQLPKAALVSVLCALFAVFRYLQVVLVHAGGDNPVRILLRDRLMVINAAIWFVLLAGFEIVHRYS